MDDKWQPCECTGWSEPWLVAYAVSLAMLVMADFKAEVLIFHCLNVQLLLKSITSVRVGAFCGSLDTRPCSSLTPTRFGQGLYC